jgi:hypothetical protein
VGAGGSKSAAEGIPDHIITAAGSRYLGLAQPAYRGRVRVLVALGAVFVVVGVIWLGQGVGIIGGSFMTGEAVWAVIGVLCIGAGAFLIRTGFRWRKAASVDDDG